MIFLNNATMEKLFEVARGQGADIALNPYEQECVALTRQTSKIFPVARGKVKKVTGDEDGNVKIQIEASTTEADRWWALKGADIAAQAPQVTIQDYLFGKDTNQEGEATASEDQADLFEGDGDTEQAPPEIIIDGEIHQLVPITEEPDTADMVVDANGEVFEIDEITIGEDAVTSFALTPLGDENPSETVTFDDLKECFRLAEPTGKQSAELSIEDLHKGDTIRLIEDMGAYPVGAEFNVIEAALDTGKVTCTEIVGDAPDAVLSGDGQPFVVDADHISTLFLKVSDQN